MKHAILHFVTTLAVASKDSLKILLQSLTLAQSIVFFLRDISDPLWEEDEEFYASNELIDWYASPDIFKQPSHTICALRTIETMLRTTILLHYIILGSELPAGALRQKLFIAQRRRFNGVRHMFFVTLGRLSYATPPDALSYLHKQRMDQISGALRHSFRCLDERTLMRSDEARHREGAVRAHC